MADEKTTIKEMIDCVADFEQARDWARFHAPKNLAMGLAIETGELLEHFQWISEDDSRKVVDDPQTMGQVKEEMADVFCYLLTMAHTMDVDLSEAFYEKMKRNNQKYPADKYYGKYKL
jgi:NTP pyrophosphatase (non-canonical NTP hydrolase)